MPHLDLTDAQHWFPGARWVGWSGRIGARRAQGVIGRRAVALFGTALLDSDASSPW
ncbi:MAG: hypothetical protein ACTHW4_09700 [Actinomycetales bacterium]